MRISVGIPCYNEETTIRYTLQSVILQENVDVDEIIICLSGTTDQTGMAVVHGQEWTVRTRNDNEIIEPGEEAKILAISGVKLIVEKV